MVKKKFLSKLMMVTLVLCSMFLISACSWQKDINIKSIAIDEDSVPTIIRVGEFDNAGIQLIVTYDDDKFEYVPVTTEMIPQEYSYCLETPGIYSIEILFKKEKAILNITIVEAATYMVEFYNGKQQLLDRQFVKEGEDAVAPSASAYTMYGYEFVGWDRTFTEVSEDIKVYGVYTKLTTEDMNTLIHGKMVDALTYMYSHDYVVTLANDNGGQLIYHFDEESQQGFSQALGFSQGEINFIQNSSIEKIEIYETDEATGEWQIEVEELTDEGLSEEQKALAVMFGGEMAENLFKEDAEWTYSYRLTENRNIYTVEVKYEYYDEISQQVGYVETVVLTFDDEKVFSAKVIDQQEPDYEEVDFEYLIDYITEDFVTIEDQDLFLNIYNETRENVLAQTTLRQEEIEGGEGHNFYRNIKDNNAYIYSTHPDGTVIEDWIIFEGDCWYEYGRTTIDGQQGNIRKEDISDEIGEMGLVEYYSKLFVFNEEMLSMIDSFTCFVSGETAILKFSAEEQEDSMEYFYIIENNLIARIEVYFNNKLDLVYTFSYDAEDVEMVELPTDVEWNEN